MHFSDDTDSQPAFALFERGEIAREELQALMALLARELISEMPFGSGAIRVRCRISTK